MEELIQAEEMACENTAPEEIPEVTPEEPEKESPETEPEEAPEASEAPEKPEGSEEQEEPEEPEEPEGSEEEQERPRKPFTLVKALSIVALVMALVTGALTAVCWPYFGQEIIDDPELLVRPMETIHIRLPESTEPLEDLPQPEKNPYGRLDFQYEGRYLGCIKAETIPGIDVSYYQGTIDWEKVKASGIEFAIIRLGYRGYGKEGKLVEDKMYWQNIQNAITAGLDVGVYFFSQAVTVEEALEEAEFVLERIKNYDITMPVVYDWEYVSEEARTANMDRRTLTDCYLAFCGKLEEAGYTPMAYFNPNQARNLMNLTELEDYPFWLAFYTDRMTYPYRFEMWQYTDSGKVPGIEGPVDLNLYFTDSTWGN